MGPGTRTTYEKFALIASVIGGILAGLVFGAVTGSLVAAFAGLDEGDQILWMSLLVAAGVLVGVGVCVSSHNEGRRIRHARQHRSVSLNGVPPLGSTEYYLWKRDQERNNPFWRG